MSEPRRITPDLAALPPDRQPLVSIVTPVYNGERYLAETIESVLVQTYRTWEYIIHDNHSTDATPEIAARYAVRDPRIRVIRTAELLSQAVNHNDAVRAMSPESAYCKVIQADDLLFPDCVMAMVCVAERHPEVIMVSSYRMDGDAVGGVGLPLGREIAPGREISREVLLGGPDFFGGPSGLLFRSDALRDRPLLEEGYFFHNDDKATCYELLEHGDYGFVHQVLTYTRVHPGQETSFIDRVQSWPPAELALLLRYGPSYLSPRELSRRTWPWIARYAWMLGKQTVKLRQWRDSGFREHHLEAFQRLERGFEQLGMHGRARLLGMVRNVLGLPRSAG